MVKTSPSVKVSNSYLSVIPTDELHHFGLTKSDDLKPLFGDTKFVCTGGSSIRMRLYAERFSKETGVEMSENLSSTDRFCLYKTGQVLWVNHGMGCPSLSIMLNETIKLLHYAGAKDVTFIRLGTCGGIGVGPGTVIISTGALNGALQPVHSQYIGGKLVNRDAFIDKNLSNELFEVSQKLGIPSEQGITWCTDDFYEGQMRIDGAWCEYSKNEREKFFENLYKLGVRNAEMEATCFAALTYRAGIRNAIVCMAVDRCEDEWDAVEAERLREIEMRSFNIVTTLIKEELGLTPVVQGY